MTSQLGSVEMIMTADTRGKLNRVPAVVAASVPSGAPSSYGWCVPRNAKCLVVVRDMIIS